MTAPENTKTTKRRELIKLYAPLLIWIGVIFFMSSSQASMSQTSRIIRPILEFLFPTAPPETITFYHGIIRKLAHFSEYAVLGFLAWRAFVRSSWRFVLAAVLVLAVAAIDETNQSFNPARTGSPIDVLIDLSGGIVAIIFCYWWNKRRDAWRASSN